MPIKLNTASSGSVTLDAVNTAGNFVISVPATTATMAINGPAFSASRASQQTISSATFTKSQLNLEEFDTNSNYDTTNFRFTPTVSGYYQVNGRFGVQTTDTRTISSIYKNGAEFKRGFDGGSASVGSSVVTALIYLNGSTDYIEFFVWVATGQNIVSSVQEIYFQASMVRAA